MIACARKKDGVCSEWFKVAQELLHECPLFPLRFNVLFAAILLLVLKRCSYDADVLADLAQPSEVDCETCLECV